LPTGKPLLNAAEAAAVSLDGCFFIVAIPATSRRKDAFR